MRLFYIIIFLSRLSCGIFNAKAITMGYVDMFTK